MGPGISVPEHLPDSHETVPQERGVFLGRTWPMHPSVTEFISVTSLTSVAPCCGLQGCGPRSRGHPLIGPPASMGRRKAAVFCGVAGLSAAAVATSVQRAGGVVVTVAR